MQIGVNVNKMYNAGFNPFSGHANALNCSLSRFQDGVVWYSVGAEEGACGNVRMVRTHLGALKKKSQCNKDFLSYIETSNLQLNLKSSLCCIRCFFFCLSYTIILANICTPIHKIIYQPM